MFRKFVLSSIAALILFLSSSASFVHAQGPWYDQTWQQFYTKVYDTSNPQEIFGERYTVAQVQWVIYGLFSYILGMMLPNTWWQCVFSAFSDCSLTTANSALGSDNLASADVKTTHSSMFQVLTQDRPLSGITYTKDKLRNFHLVPEAKAQTGFGYGAFGIVQNLWSAARNITYALMIFVIIAFSFMIMFRTKISPQAVITVQSALPKVVITLILITFSYAIAGFMVDLMYVSIGLISVMFSNSGLVFAIEWWDKTAGATALFDMLINGPANTGMAGLLTIYWGYFMTAMIAASYYPAGVGSAIAGLFGTQLTVVTAPISIIVSLVVSIMLIFVSFRVFVTLIKTFVNIILLVIAGPFLILIGAISPANGGVMGWIRSLLSHLAVYPVVALLFLVSLIFMSVAYSSTGIGQLVGDVPALQEAMRGLFAVSGLVINVGANTGSTWVPPLTFGADIGIVWLWLFASISTLSLIPRTAEIVKSFITGKPFAYGTGIGEAFGPAAAGTAAGFAGGQYLAQQRAANLRHNLGPNAAEAQRYDALGQALGWAGKKIGGR